MGVSMRLLLLSLIVAFGLAPAASGRAQQPERAVGAEPFVAPNAEVHRITAPGGRVYFLYVQLPGSYARSDTTLYPVLYLTDAEAELFGLFTGHVALLQTVNKVRDVILVGVADGSIAEHFGGQLRVLDYTPTVRPPRRSGGAPAFLTFLREQAIPFIEERYRADPADRGIWGHSLGGLFTAFALLEHPATFHRFIASSPTLIYDDRVLVKRAAEHRPNRDSGDSRVYSAYGALEPAVEVQAWQAFFDTLEAAGNAGLRLYRELVPEADHLSVMPIAFLRGMVALYGRRPIELALDSVIGRDGISAAVSLYHHLARTERQEYDFSEVQLNRLGYRLLRSGRVPEAVAILQLNVEQYPASWNAYDSLGEAYMAAGDRQRAIENYGKSLQLNPQNTGAIEMLRRLGAG
jgi:predicted alpha/beta superfamily hydrolase